MNLSHLKTITWLRWRIIVNQFRKIGRGHKIISIFVIAVGCIAAIAMGIAGFALPLPMLEKAPPSIYLLIWAGLSMVYVTAWGIGVLTDLQQKEPLTLDKFLHLPISPTNAFVNNFLSSFLSFSTVLIFPTLLGFAGRMVAMFGMRLAPIFLLLFAFFLMIMAVTYQFRSWIGGLMLNKRRRRTILSVATVIFIIVVQIPNLINMRFQASTRADVVDPLDPEISMLESEYQKQDQDFDKWLSQFPNGEAPKEEITRKIDELDKLHRRLEELDGSRKVSPDDPLATGIDTDAAMKIEKRQQRRNARIEQLADYAWIACIALPFGWLAIGINSMVTEPGINGVLVPLLCLFGMLGLSFFSLRRSYKSTLRLYRGETQSHKPQSQNQQPIGDYSPTWINRLSEKKFPLLNEQQSAVTGMTLIGLLRAPEAKMVLLSPLLVILLIGGSFAFRNAEHIPVNLRVFGGLGAISFTMLGIMNLTNNQFGYDRQGFRCLLLSPIKRVDILIGKNAAYAPFAFAIGTIGLSLMQCFMPMPIGNFLAVLVQLGNIFLITCMLGNLMSIKAPMAISSGTMKPSNINLSVATIQILLTLMLPICLLPTLLPPVVDLLVNRFYATIIPIDLLLSIGLFAVTLVVYRFIVARQANMLRERESIILEKVTHIGS